MTRHEPSTLLITLCLAASVAVGLALGAALNAMHPFVSGTTTALVVLSVGVVLWGLARSNRTGEAAGRGIVVLMVAAVVVFGAALQIDTRAETAATQATFVANQTCAVQSTQAAAVACAVNASGR